MDERGEYGGAMKDKQLKRCLELPCVDEMAYGDMVKITFHSEIIIGRAEFEANTVMAMRRATAQLEWSALESIRQKRRVLLEIEADTNDYTITPSGTFRGVFGDRHK